MYEWFVDLYIVCEKPEKCKQNVMELLVVESM